MITAMAILCAVAVFTAIVVAHLLIRSFEKIGRRVDAHLDGVDRAAVRWLVTGGISHSDLGGQP